MKRLIYAVIAVSTLGLATGGLAIAADNDAQAPGSAIMQNDDAGTQGAGPADEGTVNQQQDQDQSSSDESKPDEEK